jgi:hypothetical protein
MSKGSKPRPVFNRERFDREFDRIFKKPPDKKKKAKKKDSGIPK